MSTKLVDARGLSCPQPVIETRKVLMDGKAGSVEVIVDNDAASENVARMARSQGCEVRLEDRTDGVIRLLLTREEGTGEGAPDKGETEAEANACRIPDNVAVLLSSRTLGEGDEDLGRLLMVAFVKTLEDLVPRPRTLLFMNGGVHHAVEGSELVDVLTALERDGIEIFVCGTCLDFFGLKDSLAVGKISNMFEISSKLVAADRIVRP